MSSNFSARYGLELGSAAESPFWAHRSVRRFSDKLLSPELSQSLAASAQSAATSSNLQTWSVVSVSNRAAIAPLCGDQKQIISAAEFFVFLADLNRTATYSRAHGLVPDGLDTVEMYTVATIDAALAAERLVCAAESEGLGICYIGALRNQPHAVTELLRLPKLTAPLFGLCVGYPDENDRSAVKPRLQQDQVFFEDSYASNLDASEYDVRVGEFFTAQGMSTDAPWSVKCAQRTMISGLNGREKWLEYLQSQGLCLR